MWLYMGVLPMHLKTLGSGCPTSSSCSLLTEHLGFSQPLSVIIFCFRMNTMRRSTIWFSKVNFVHDFSVVSLWHLGCALRPDLALMPNGDLTEVGEKGLFPYSSLNVLRSWTIFYNLGITVSLINIPRHSVKFSKAEWWSKSPNCSCPCDLCSSRFVSFPTWSLQALLNNCMTGYFWMTVYLQWTVMLLAISSVRYSMCCGCHFAWVQFISKQITLLDQTVCSLPRPEFSWRTISHSSNNLIHFFIFDVVSFWNKVLTRVSSLIPTVRLPNLCIEFFFPWTMVPDWQTTPSRGHQTGSSGTSTPFAEGTTTPESDQYELEVPVLSDDLFTLAEKLKHRNSFRKARLVSSVDLHLQSAPLTKEHQEQGRVKIEVYTQYIQAASKFGFLLFVFLNFAQQALSVFATIVLRYWGEHNRKTGSNSGMLEYLLLYGGFSFGSSILGALSALLLWVYCALRSSRHLHDSVSTKAKMHMDLTSRFEQMLNALMHAPLSFFELTPTGRSMNKNFHKILF